MDFPSGLALPAPLGIITPHAACGLGGLGSLGGPSSAVYPAADRAHFYPFRLARPFPVKILFAYNGTAVSGNIDVGIYDEKFTRLVSSGSTAQAGLSAMQVFDVADTLLGAGIFYLAVSMDNVTGTLFRSNLTNSAFSRAIGITTLGAGFPLPATAAPSAGTQTYLAVVGASRYAVV